jgi:hypothetical protein
MWRKVRTLKVANLFLFLQTFANLLGNKQQLSSQQNDMLKGIGCISEFSRYWYITADISAFAKKLNL